MSKFGEPLVLLGGVCESHRSCLVEARETMAATTICLVQAKGDQKVRVEASKDQELRG